MSHKNQSVLNLTLVSLLTFACSLALAQNFVEVPVMTNDVLVIKGLDLQVSLQRSAGNNLKITGIDNSTAPGAYRAERRGNQIHIVMTEYDSKRDWKSILSQKSNRKKIIEIKGPAIPVEIHAREAVLNINQWPNKVDAHLVNGKINSQQGRDLSFSFNSGECNVSDNQGYLKANVSQGQINVKNSQSDGDMQVQSGQINLEKTNGHWNINTQNANVKVNQGAGVLQIDNQKGIWNVSKYKGRVDGQLRDGNINMSLLEDSEVNIKSQSGKIQIQVPQGAGSMLNLLSFEGDLYLPGDLKANRGGNEKSYRGRLRGDAQKISVTARSQEGLIILKY